MNFAETDWKTVRRVASGGGVAVIPMGSLEAHGPHLPCGTDAFQIEEIIRRAVAGCDDSDRVIVFPGIDYTIVEWAAPFASIGIAPRTLVATLVDIGKSAVKLGFRKIVFCQGHGGLPVVQTAFWQLRYEGHYALYVDVQPYLLLAETEMVEICGEPIGHAGVAETAMMLALRPDRVDLSAAVDGPAQPWGDDFPYPSLTSSHAVCCIPSAEALPDLVQGAARRATAEMGEILLDRIARKLGEVLAELLAQPVPMRYLRTFTRDLD